MTNEPETNLSDFMDYIKSPTCIATAGEYAKRKRGRPAKGSSHFATTSKNPNHVIAVEPTGSVKQKSGRFPGFIKCRGWNPPAPIVPCAPVKRGPGRPRKNSVKTTINTITQTRKIIDQENPKEDKSLEIENLTKELKDVTSCVERIELILKGITSNNSTEDLSEPVDKVITCPLEPFVEVVIPFIEFDYIPAESLEEVNFCSDACCVCSHADLTEPALQCGNCQKTLHLKCMKPALQSTPIGPWFCVGCVSKGLSNEILREAELKGQQLFYPGKGVEVLWAKFCWYSATILKIVDSEQVVILFQNEKIATVKNIKIKENKKWRKSIQKTDSGLDIDSDEIDVTLCTVCGISENDDKTILCDGCNHGFHLYCFNPPISSIPDDSWFCVQCKTEKKNETFKSLTPAVVYDETCDIIINDDDRDETSSEDRFIMVRHTPVRPPPALTVSKTGIRTRRKFYFYEPDSDEQTTEMAETTDIDESNKRRKILAPVPTNLDTEDEYAANELAGLTAI